METEKKKLYSFVHYYLKSAIDENKRIHSITVLSECVNLLSSFFREMSWVGFYLVEDDYLYLGPYLKGYGTTEEINKGEGLIGKAYEDEEVQICADVTKIEGYDSATGSTKSEIAVPVFKKNKVVAVLDINSDHFDAFDDVDEKNLEKIVKLIGSVL